MVEDKIIEQGKATIEVLAKKADMPKEELNKLYQKIELELKEQGKKVTEERVLGRMQKFLKRKLVGTSNLVTLPGFLMGRTTAMDRAKKHIKLAKDYIEKYDEATAIQDGYLNEKGEYLYVDDRYKKGKPVPEHDFEADGYGIIAKQIKVDGEDALDMRYADIKLRGEAAIEPIEFFKESMMRLYPVECTDENRYKFSMSSLPKDVDKDYINKFEDKIVPLIKAAYPSRVVKSLSNAEKMFKIQEDENVWNPWLLISGDVFKINISDKGWNIVSIDDLSLGVEESDDKIASLAVLFNPQTVMDLNVDADDAHFLVGPSRNKEDGKVGYFGLGYYVDEFGRAKNDNATEVPDVTNPFGS
jgi:hypothetical protein